jgi:hypothetical protein
MSRQLLVTQKILSILMKQCPRKSPVYKERSGRLFRTFLLLRQMPQSTDIKREIGNSHRYSHNHNHRHMCNLSFIISQAAAVVVIVATSEMLLSPHKTIIRGNGRKFKPHQTMSTLLAALLLAFGVRAAKRQKRREPSISCHRIRSHMASSRNIRRAVIIITTLIITITIIIIPSTCPLTATLFPLSTS